MCDRIATQQGQTKEKYNFYVRNLKDRAKIAQVYNMGALSYSHDIRQYMRNGSSTPNGGEG